MRHNMFTRFLAMFMALLMCLSAVDAGIVPVFAEGQDDEESVIVEEAAAEEEAEAAEEEEPAEEPEEDPEAKPEDPAEEPVAAEPEEVEETEEAKKAEGDVPTVGINHGKVNSGKLFAVIDDIATEKATTYYISTNSNASASSLNVSVTKDSEASIELTKDTTYYAFTKSGSGLWAKRNMVGSFKTVETADPNESVIELNSSFGKITILRNSDGVETDALYADLFKAMVKKTTPEMTVEDVTFTFAQNGEEVAASAMKAGTYEVTVSYPGKDPIKPCSNKASVEFLDEIVVELTHGEINGSAIHAAVKSQYASATTYYIADTTSNPSIIASVKENTGVIELAPGVHYVFTGTEILGNVTNTKLVCRITAVETANPNESVIELNSSFGKITILRNSDGVETDALYADLFQAMVKKTTPEMTAEDVTFTFEQEGEEVKAADLKAGTYEVTVSYPGKDPIKPCSAKASVEFLDEIVVEVYQSKIAKSKLADVLGAQYGGGTFYISNSATNTSNTTAVGGLLYSSGDIELSEGVYYAFTKTLVGDNFTLICRFTVKETYNPAVTEITLNEKIDQVTIYKNEDGVETETLYADLFEAMVKSTTPEMTVDDVAFTFAQGEDAVEAADLKAGTYKVTVTFAGDEEYDALSVSASVKLVDEIVVEVYKAKIDGKNVYKAIHDQYGPTLATSYDVYTSADRETKVTTVKAAYVLEDSTASLAAGVYFAFNGNTLVCRFTVVDTFDPTISSITLKKNVGTITILQNNGAVDTDALLADVFEAMVDSSVPEMTLEDVTITFAQNGEEVAAADMKAGTYEVTIKSNGKDGFDPCEASKSVKFVDEIIVKLTLGKVKGSSVYNALHNQYGPLTAAEYRIADSATDSSTGTNVNITSGDIELTTGIHYAYAKALLTNDYTLVGRITVVETLDPTVSAIVLKNPINTVAISLLPGRVVDEETLQKDLFAAMVELTNPAMTADDVTFTFEQDGTEVAMSALKAGTYDVTVSFAGNEDFDACSETASVTFTISEKISIVYKEGATITYNMDPEVMKQQLFEQIIDWDKSILPEDVTKDDLIFEYRPSNDLLKLIGIDIGINLNPWYDIAGAKLATAQVIPPMGAGVQEVRVRNSSNGVLGGILDYFGSSSVKVTVKKASLKLKVRTTSAYADQGAPADMVTITPNDPAVSVITVYTGATSDISLAIYVDMPSNALADSRLIQAIDPIIKRIIGISFVDMIKNGITMRELRNLVNADDLLDVLDLLGYDSSALRQVLNVLNVLPSLTDNVRIAFNTPNRAGVYNVTAIAGNANYTTAIGMGTLTLKMRMIGAKLTWNEKIPGSIKASEIGNFNFGATVMFKNQPAHLQDNVKLLFTGMTSKLRPYSSSKVPTEPGSYVVTARTIGGSYYCLPITRTFRIVKG